MTVSIPASEIAEGDYSPVYGTVKKVKENRDRKTNALKSIDFTFYNGTLQFGTEPDKQYDILQGGLRDNVAETTVRAGLDTDHPDRRK